MRLGAVPDTEVKIPQVPPGKVEHPVFASVRWSSQYGKIRYVRLVSGRQVFVKIESRAHELKSAVGVHIRSSKGLVV